MKDGQRSFTFPNGANRFNPYCIFLIILSISYFAQYALLILEPYYSGTFEPISLVPEQLFFTLITPLTMLVWLLFYFILRRVVWKMEYDHEQKLFTCDMFTKLKPVEFYSDNIDLIWFNWKTHVFLKNGQEIRFRNSSDLYDFFMGHNHIRRWGKISQIEPSIKEYYEKDRHGKAGGWFFNKSFLGD